MNKINIVSWNVNSLKAAFEKDGFHQLLNRKVKPDIICVQEAKLKLSDPRLTSLLSYMEGLGYVYKYEEVAEKKGYSGVTTFSKLELTVVPMGESGILLHEEGRVQHFLYKGTHLFNVYFPSGSNDERVMVKNAFNHTFSSYLNKSRFNKVVILGDFNICQECIDITTPSNKHGTSGFLPHERAWLKTLTTEYKDTFREAFPKKQKFTWWSYRGQAKLKGLGWRLDYILATKSVKWERPVILENVPGSDHCPIGVMLCL